MECKFQKVTSSLLQSTSFSWSQNQTTQGIQKWHGWEERRPGGLTGSLQSRFGAQRTNWDVHKLHSVTVLHACLKSLSHPLTNPSSSTFPNSHCYLTQLIYSQPSIDFKITVLSVYIVVINLGLNNHFITPDIRTPLSSKIFGLYKN